jgi:hypothetical protein
VGSQKANVVFTPTSEEGASDLGALRDNMRKAMLEAGAAQTMTR